MGDGRYAQARFGEAADHDLQVRLPGTINHSPGRCQAAAFAELDIDTEEITGTAIDVRFDLAPVIAEPTPDKSAAFLPNPPSPAADFQFACNVILLRGKGLTYSIEPVIGKRPQIEYVDGFVLNHIAVWIPSRIPFTA